jgi:5-methylcytosine-specific restriction endonuclease McrA
MRWTEVSIKERERLVLFMINQGLSDSDIAANFHTQRENVRDFRQRRGWQGLAQGAQPNNQNAMVDGLSANTIKRLTREVILKAGRDLYTCERCGFNNPERELARHHKDRSHADNSPENLEVLCDRCHATEHLTDRIRDENGQFI